MNCYDIALLSMYDVRSIMQLAGLRIRVVSLLEAKQKHTSQIRVKAVVNSLSPVSNAIEGGYICTEHILIQLKLQRCLQLCEAVLMLHSLNASGIRKRNTSLYSELGVFTHYCKMATPTAPLLSPLS